MRRAAALGVLLAAVCAAGAADPDTRLYRAHVAAAAANLRLWEVGAARAWLDEAPVGPRHWEWRYLEAASDLSDRTLTGHEGTVLSVAYSPNGRLVASAGADGSVRLWDARSGAPLRVLRGHEKDVTGLAFQPGGRRLASSSRDTTIRIWSLESGKEEQVLRGHTQPVACVAWSPDGARLASGSYARSKERPIYGVIRLWDAAAGNSVREIPSDQYAPITSVRFSPDGARLLAGSWDQSVKVYALDQEREPLVRVLAPEVGYRAVNSVAWSPDGTAFASGGKDHLVRLWDAASASERARLEGHGNGVWSVAFSPGGDRLASASVDQTIRVWDARSHAPGPVLVGHRATIRAVAWAPDGKALASASEDGTLKLWDLAAIERRSRRSLPGGASAYGMTFTADGNRLVVALAEGGVAVLDVRTAAVLATLTHEGFTCGLALSPDGKLLAVGGADSMVHIWDTSTWSERASISGHEAGICGTAFLDGDRVVSAARDRTVRISPLGDEGPAQKVLRGHEREADALAVGSDGTVASGDYAGVIRLWDGASGHETGVLRGHSGNVVRLTWSADGLLASAGADGTVRLWDAGRGQQHALLLGHGAEVNALAFSPDGKRLASGSSDATVRIWDVDEARELLSLANLHASIFTLAFSPDGARLAVGDLEGGYQILEAVPLAQRPAASAVE